VRIAAGTDAGIAGSLHGRALHRELELYVEAGMTPIEALRAATENPAELLGLADRGKLAEGMLADVVVVTGDPTTDISAVRNVERVFRRGAELVPADLSILGSTSLRRTTRTGLAAGELCSFADECGSGMICDVTNARCVPTCTFPASGSCPSGSACFPMAAYTGQDFCMIGDGCDALAQSCDNGAACVFVGNASTHCWPASSALDGQPCVSGACAPGHQCDPNGAVCRQICDPGAPSCPSCLDMSSFAGFEVGVCH
jgi:hypothetical protein